MDDNSQIRVRVRSEGLRARLDAVCNRIGIPAATLCLIALDAYLPVLPAVHNAPAPAPAKKKPAPKKRKPAAAEFVPPSLAEVEAHFLSRGLADADLHAEMFFSHFEGRGWRLGNGTGRPMRSWKQSVDNWARTKQLRIREKERKAAGGAMPAADPGAADWSA